MLSAFTKTEIVLIVKIADNDFGIPLVPSLAAAANREKANAFLKLLARKNAERRITNQLLYLLSYASLDE